mgnify:CR=1 FL=1
MSAVYRLIGTEISIATANTVSNSKLVRIVNTSGSATVLTLTNSGVYANTTVGANEILTIEKAPTDTVAGTNLRATPIAYRN